MKVLILKPSSLGDVVQALPVLRLLKRHLPHAQISWWIDESLAPLLHDDPDLHTLLPFPRRRWNNPRRWPEIWTFIRHVQAQHFDWVIDLQSLARSGLLAWLARGRLTVGLDDPREGARALYDLIIRRPSRLTHAVDWYLEALRPLGVPVDPHFVWLPPRPGPARELETIWPRTPSGPWIALQPGARWDNKRWPTPSFANLVRLLARQQPGLRFVILGGAHDQSLAQPILEAAGPHAVDLSGRTTLPGMIEALRRCDLLVTNDTGPMHVAAALGKPVVGLFGPTEPRRTGPYGQTHLALQDRSLPCVPCMKPYCTLPNPMECLSRLTPELVARAVLDRLPT